MNNQIEEIKKILVDFLTKLSVSFDDIDIDSDGNGNYRLAVRSEDSKILIGSEGKNIRALNYLFKQIIWKNNKEDKGGFKFFIDINDYQTQNIERIKRKAIDVAQKAVVFKRDIEMEPMSSFERMIVHSVLADNNDINTESTGFGSQRRLVVKFNGEKDF